VICMELADLSRKDCSFTSENLSLVTKQPWIVHIAECGIDVRGPCVFLAVLKFEGNTACHGRSSTHAVIHRAIAGGKAPARYAQASPQQEVWQ
jgi:hypothetical protein